MRLVSTVIPEGNNKSVILEVTALLNLELFTLTVTLPAVDDIELPAAPGENS